MLKLKLLPIVLICFCSYTTVKGQTTNDTISKETKIYNELRDSLHKIHVIVGQINQDLTFKGTRIVGHEEGEGDEHGKLIINGYISSYYAYYSDDSIPVGEYQQFPTTSPISNTFGLDLMQLGAKYNSEHSRAVLTLHYGDIPQCAWSPRYNYIQEANAGVMLLPKLWFDAGFFRTHIGLESIQPRENIASSIAVITYYEPYFMSGAKLTYQLNPKLIVQVNGFNSFNTWVETNRKKAGGLSIVYDPFDKMSVTFNTLYSDDAVKSATLSKGRLYNNLYLTYRNDRLTLGFEANLGIQEHSRLSDSTATATMYSTLIAAKYKVFNKTAVYGRCDYFADPNEILTGPIYSDYHKLIGLKTAGYTVGIEYKPINSSYLRLESRLIRTATNEEIFYLNNKPSRSRYEILASIGVWF